MKRTTSPTRLLVVGAAALALFAAPLAARADVAPPSVPPVLAVPAGNMVHLVGHAAAQPAGAGAGAPRPVAGYEVREGWASLTPLRRNALAEDVAGPIAFLAGDAARFVTGAHLPADGGVVMP